VKTKTLDEMFQESHDAIFASGAFSAYGWWLDLESMHMNTIDGMVPSYWGYRLTGEGPEEDDAPVSVEIWHTTLTGIMRRIADGDFGGEADLVPPTRCVGSKTAEECANFLAGRETDFDADTADQVLQALVYGGVVFG